MEISSLKGKSPQRSQHQQSNNGENKQQSKTGGNGQGNSGGNGQTPLTLTLIQPDKQPETPVTQTSLDQLLQQQTNRGYPRECVDGETWDVSHLNVVACNSDTGECKEVATMRASSGGTCGSCQWSYTYK